MRRLSAGEAEDQVERPLRPGPVLAEDAVIVCADEGAQDKGGDDHVVELAGDRDKVGNQVEGNRQVAEQCEEQKLRRLGTRGSRSKRLVSTAQSGMKPASARASSRRPANSRNSTKPA